MPGYSLRPVQERFVFSLVSRGSLVPIKGYTFHPLADPSPQRHVNVSGERAMQLQDERS